MSALTVHRHWEEQTTMERDRHQILLWRGAIEAWALGRIAVLLVILPN